MTVGKVSKGLVFLPVVAMLLAVSLLAYAVASAQSTVTPATVKVFFPKTSDPTFDHVYSVTRYVVPPVTATEAEMLVIAGPTLREQSTYGVYSEVNEILTGPSSCGHRDFTITLDHRGQRIQQGTATYQFCRATQSPGIGADARISSQISATLRQFIAVKTVVILTQSGHCFGDMSGLDLCLK